MGQISKIEWTDASWTALRARVKDDAADIARVKGYTSLIQIAERMAGHVGPHCEHCSPGCDHCYSETNNGRCLPANGTGLPFDRRSRELVEPFLDEKILVQPLRWRKPRKVFVCSQTDLFGEWVPDAAIDRVCAVMALTPHIYQVLTKRAARMLEWSTRKFLAGDVQVHANDLRDIHRIRCAAGLQGKFKLSPEEQLEISDVDTWPLPNVWLGVSVEDQKTADERIPPLLQTPAAVRFVSAEPLLGPVDLTAIPRCLDDNDPRHLQTEELRKDDPLEWLRLLRHGAPGLDLIIVGGESGPGARPMSPDWARSIRDQCQAAGVPFFFKQWGEWGPAIDTDGDMVARRLGKKAGRLLDGRTWDEFPP